MDIEKILFDIRVRAMKLGLTDAALSKEAGIMPATFSAWRNGKATPNLRKIKAVNDALDRLERENQRKSK